ncbi:hypothetical protein JMJ35_004074 [Cladonia borealis]|uniref:Protein kinase domain-containing protein n=1 Tax=Cladonia borealis TaxID=184061 RepID=A0AA39V259_9LECA|nr:hypothetical protein JMJ35_004074 [Cladonia borealis]
MIDPASIVGLTFAIFDQLLKLGERSAELTADIRGFSDNLHERIKFEDTRTRALRSLLFEPSTVYDGQRLFEQFEEDVQEQIRSYLGQLVGILSQAYQLLTNRYGSSTTSGEIPELPPSLSLRSNISNTSLTSTSNELPSTTAVPSRSGSLKRSRSPLLMLRWSFYDKKQTEKIVRDFGDLNSRIMDHIKLTDDNSKKLGFDVDATLKLNVGETRDHAQSLEIMNPEWIDQLHHTQHVDGEFAVLNCIGARVLEESRTYVPFPQTPHGLDPRTKDRVDALARLLQQPKEQVFRIPRCIGWKFVSSQNRIAFLFEVLPDVKPQPVSLIKLLENLDMKMSLGGKFRLAHSLAKCMAQLHMVRWVHESFRSENILFYPSLDTTKISTSSHRYADINFGEPWVLGFEYSRPDMDFSAGFVDMNANRDVYRHPERQGQPQKMFNKMHDIYALGVVLLEIGLWEPAITLEKNKFMFVKDPNSVKTRLVMHAERRLESKVGGKYQDVVLKCLHGDFGIQDDSKEDLKLQQTFRGQVVDVLERAAQNV